jgi:hypothetical protein
MVSRRNKGYFTILGCYQISDNLVGEVENPNQGVALQHLQSKVVCVWTEQ